MMKITTYKDGETLTLKLEGRLTGSWVEELKGCWQAAGAMHKVQRIRLDLSEVSFVDDEGKAALALIQAAGSEISATNVLTRFIVEEITGETQEIIQ
jgi:ABC-type transporter Mla MlaB component